MEPLALLVVGNRVECFVVDTAGHQSVDTFFDCLNLNFWILKSKFNFTHCTSKLMAIKQDNEPIAVDKNY